MIRQTSWTSAIPPDRSALLVVNSAPSQLAEVARAFEALAATISLARIFVIAPSSLRRWFLGRGLRADRVLATRLDGVDVELGYFMASTRALRWTARLRPDVVLGSEPYAPNNEEVKESFEALISPILGDGLFVAHSLPDSRLFLLSVDELWERSGRREALAAHAERSGRALGALYEAWLAAGRPIGAVAPPEPADLTASFMPRPDAPNAVSAAYRAAARRSYDQLLATVRSTGLDRPPEWRVAPSGRTPAAGWMPPRVKPMGSPRSVAAGVAWRGTRMVMRGVADAPYSYLLASPPTMLQRGDAAMAEVCIYRGGISIGLVKDGAWSSRVDLDQPGEFIAVAIAVEPGEHTLVVANCLRGEDREVAVALRRYGWAKKD